jgi:hypothetical protein
LPEFFLWKGFEERVPVKVGILEHFRKPPFLL